MKKANETINSLSSKTFFIIFWGCIYIALFLFLQYKEKFHFFFIEQTQLFLYDISYIQNLLNKPGGIAQILSDYFIQFFHQPYLGAFITSALITLIGIQTYTIIKTIAPHANILFLSVLPMAAILLVSFNMNYYYKGTFAFYITIVAFYFYIRIKSIKTRLIASIVLSSILLWATGPTAFLFALCVLLYEIFTNFKKSYLFLIPLLLTIAEAYLCIYNSWIGEYRLILLPDGYYEKRLSPIKTIYISWFCIAAIIIISCLLRNKKESKRTKYIIENAICLLIVAICSYTGIKKYAYNKSYFYEELDYYMRNEQWDNIIKRCEKRKINNFLYKCCFNIALAEKGELLDKIFDTNQLGWQGICLEWNKNSYISILLSDEYFSMGEIALSQRMAFEANESYDSSCPRALKRLIQTNLLYGSFPVAEKYISRLVKSKYYSKWARDCRKFLNNNDAINKDSILGLKRKCIIDENRFAGLDEITTNLLHIAEQNPKHKATIQYAGAIFLLTKDTESIQSMIEKYYKTDVLPNLPKSLQEAVFTYSEKDPGLWSKYDIQKQMINKYEQYRQLFLEAKKYNSAEAYNSIKRNYENTYWFYFMFKREN